jgi:succinate-acetate transporter protein
MTDEGALIDPHQATRVVLRPLANPLPLGFIGLAGGTIVLAGQQLGWVPTAQAHVVAVGVLLVAVPLQSLTCLLGFLSRDPATAIGMGTLAATWAAIGVLTLLSPPGAHSPALGLLLFYLAAAVLVAAAVASLSKGLAAVTLAVAAARFALTGVYEYLGGTGWMRVAGWVGLALCVVALLAATAFAVEDARRTLLPVTGRVGAGRQAFRGKGLVTTGPVEREAGVRDEL